MSVDLGRVFRATSRHMAWSLAAVALLACSTGAPKSGRSQAKAAGPAAMMPQIKPGPVAIKESFVARREATARLRGLTLVDSPLGPPWLYTADTSVDDLVIFDAASGRFERRFGKRGSGKGEFDGITDLYANDRILYVTEAGNKRIQLMYLPELATLGEIGSELVKSPMSVVARTTGGGHFMIYVLDRDGEKLVLRLLDMHMAQAPSAPGTDPIFSLDVSTVTITTKHVSDVPLTLAADAEVSMQLDLANDRLLIGSGNTLYSYNFDGSVRDPEIAAPGVEGQISGLGLFACPQSKEKGYWIIGDRTAEAQYFQVIDRVTLAPVTRFNGLQIKDSTALHFERESMAYFPFGAFYALNQGTSLGALNWQTLAMETGVRRVCL